MPRLVGDRLSARVAAELNDAGLEASENVNSGAVHHDGDVRCAGFMLEAKSKSINGVSVSKSEVKKGRQQAAKLGLAPAFIVESRAGMFAVLEWNTFKAMLAEGAKNED